MALAELAGRPYCPACGADASPLVIREARCPSCRGRSLPYRGLVRVGVHAGPLRRAIVRFKYHRQEKLDRTLAKLLLAAFIIMGIFFWIGWIVWALIILLLGLKHPRVVDDRERLSPGRRLIGAVVVLIFGLSFIPAPIKGYSLLELLHQWGL